MAPKTRSARRAESKQGSASAQNGGTAAECQPSTAQNAPLPPTKKEGDILEQSRESRTSRKVLDTERVVGARMSNVKHSGLLARDEETLKELVEEEGECGLPVAAGIMVHSRAGEESGGEGEEGGFQGVSGRDIYTIKSVGRSTQKAKRKRTELLTLTPGSSLQGSGKAVKLRMNVTAGEDIGTEVTASNATASESVGGNGALEKKKGKGKGKARKINWSSDSDEDRSEQSEEEEEDGGDEMASIAAQLNRGATAEHALEDYFTAHTGRGGVTSDHTLSRLSRPRLEQDDIQTALLTTPSPFQSDRQQLNKDYTQLYSYWLLQLHSGFNVLLYGLGSKKRIMEDFCKCRLSQSCHLVVNGYFPGLTVKQILTCLSSDILGHSGSFKSLSEHAQFITNTLGKQSAKKTSSSIPREVFLLIHNLDGPMLRNERAQAALSILAVSQHIHVIASVDHINAALLWDQTKLSGFNWVWHDVTTFEPYREETSYENSLLVRQSGSLALSSLTHVMKSLTPNARGIFKLLANYQLEHKQEAEKNYQGLSFGECYRRCREKFLVNSDLTLRAQLTEFKDHKLVRLVKGNDGVEYLLIPVDDATLSQFLSEFID